MQGVSFKKSGIRSAKLATNPQTEVQANPPRFEVPLSESVTETLLPRRSDYLSHLEVPIEISEKGLS